MNNVGVINTWPLNTYPQPKLTDGSWQCGGCKTWYAPWVRSCYCQQDYNYYTVGNIRYVGLPTQTINRETDEGFTTMDLGLKTTEGYNG